MLTAIPYRIEQATCLRQLQSQTTSQTTKNNFHIQDIAIDVDRRDHRPGLPALLHVVSPRL